MMAKQSQQFVVLFSTTGSTDEAESISEYLVANHLVACVNIIPSIRSVYRWNNRVQRDTEVLMVIKTEARRIPEVEDAVRRLHSYETPELIAMPLQYGLPEYLSWMESALRPDETTPD